MKKKLIITATILTLAIIASIEINLNIKEKTTSISLKNIEAVALGEGSSSGYKNAKSIYCAIPAGKIGCTSQVARNCYESVFCTR